MANTYVRKSFTFQGRRYWVYGNSLEDALEKKALLKAKLKEGPIAKGGSILLRDWYRIALETYKPNVSDRYMDEMLCRIEKHIIPEIGAYPLEKITPLQCQQILNRQKGKSRSHISKLDQELFFLFDAARKNNMITRNPAEDLIRPKGTNSKRRSITADEREHLLKVIPKDPRFVFFALMLFCGCRPAEAASVEYEDLTVINGIRFLHIRGTKTINSDRYVPLPHELQDLFSSGGHGLVALNANGRRHNESSYDRMVDALRREMNISMGCRVYRNQLIEPLPLADDFVPYLLRHTYCTDLKKKGVDIRIAKDLMGHADIKTTANIYDHDDGETLMMAARQMGLAP